MPVKDLLVPEFDQEVEKTRKLLVLVPAARFDYKPHPKSMSLGRLAGHIAEMPNWAEHALAMDVLELDAGAKAYTAESVDALLEHFDAKVRSARILLNDVTDEQLEHNWEMRFSGRTVISMSRYSVLRSVVMSHMIHHRAQLGIYLRLLEVDIPGMYGPSADEMKFWQGPVTGK